MIESYKEQQQYFRTYLHFHEEMMKVQVKNMQYLVAAISFDKLHRIDFNKIIDDGGYLINPHHILVEENDLEFIFEKILPIMKKYYKNQNELNLFEDYNDKRKLSLKQIMKNVLDKDKSVWNSSTKKYSISSHFMKKIGEYIATPYLELCSEYFSDKISAMRQNLPHCPICGRYPSMAYLKKDDEVKVFWCHLCNTEWKYKQDICPVCLNQDPKKMIHIFPRDSSFSRIDACDNCKTYMKVIDGQLQSKKPQFMVEYLKTYKLDLIAMRYGYQKPEFN